MRRNMLLSMLLVIIISTVFSVLFEILRSVLFTDISVWNSHVITILLSVLISVIFSYIFISKLERIKKLSLFFNKSHGKVKSAEIAEKHLIFFPVLIIVLTVSLVLMTSYEWLKQSLWPDISIWESHIITIIFSSLIATLSSFFILRKFNKLYLQIIHSMNNYRQSEKKIRENLIFLQQLIDDIPVSVLYTDINSIVLGCNISFEKFIGLSRDKITGRPSTEFIPENIVSEAETQHLNNNSDITIYKTKYTGKDSQNKHIDIYKSSYSNTAGENSGYVSVIMDITERKLLEERLALSEKLEAIGMLASGIAHDFNNHITTIIGCANMIDKSNEESEFLLYKENILRASQYSGKLVKGLLDFARLGKKENVSVNVHSIIEEVILSIKPILGERITILQSLNASPHTVTGDPSQIFSALMNLSINARDSIRDNGIISFSTDIETIENHTEYDDNPGLSPGKYIKLSISDSGSGMDDDTRQHIFEPFFTTKNRFEGTGMGLSVVYGTIKGHNGDINVRSILGKGTVVEILLPLEAENKIR